MNCKLKHQGFVDFIRDTFIGISEILKSSYFYSNSRSFPAAIYLFKANNENTRTMCENCSKLAIKIPERRH